MAAASTESIQNISELQDDGEARESTNRPQPVGVTLQSVTSGGSGCSQEAIIVEDDSEPGLTMSTPMLFAIGGHENSTTGYRKFCQFTQILPVEPGYQVAFDRISIQSYMSLNENFMATITGSQYFAGQSDSASFFSPFSIIVLMKQGFLDIRSGRSST